MGMYKVGGLAIVTSRKGHKRRIAEVKKITQSYVTVQVAGMVMLQVFALLSGFHRGEVDFNGKIRFFVCSGDCELQPFHQEVWDNLKPRKKAPRNP